MFISAVSPYTPHLFFFQSTPPPEFYTLSLHDALPILVAPASFAGTASGPRPRMWTVRLSRTSPMVAANSGARSEEHTSELQSHSDLVCRLLLEKKKKKKH